MKRTLLIALGLAVVLTSAAPAEPAQRTPKEALRAFQELIGRWKGTGTPAGSREVREKGFWQEMVSWQWQFKGGDAWLKADVTKGKHFTRLELRYLPKTDSFQLKATMTDKQELTFEGKLNERRLIVDRTDAKTKQTQRLTFSLLHNNRYLYKYDVKRADQTAFAQVYSVGVTNLDIPFGTELKGPECIVSGGYATMPVTHKGKTYYVCCTGCRDAFNQEPEKYVKAFEESKKKEKKE